jgi:hypothetical protein
MGCRNFLGGDKEREKAWEEPGCPRRDELWRPRGRASPSSVTTTVFSELFSSLARLASGSWMVGGVRIRP